MKYRLQCRGRSVLVSALAGALFALSLTACGKAGELSVSPLLFTESASSGQFGAASPGAASSAEASPVSRATVSSPATRASSAVPKSGSKAAKKENDVHTVKKLAVFDAAAQTGNLNVIAVDVSQSGYQRIDQRNGYGTLNTQAEKDLYGQIGKSVYQVSGTKNSMGYYPLQAVEVPSGLSEAQTCKTLVAYQDDNPQAFWIANAYSIGTQGNKTYLQLYSNLSLQQCGEFNSKFAAAVTAAVKSVPAGLNEFGREEAIFNFVVSRCGYDDAAAADQNLWQSYTAYGALVNGKAVCEGYSRAVQLLCGYEGLQCSLIRGTADGGNHMWNCVCVDGKWYQLDVTWCDNTSLIYNYFNITDRVLASTHTPAAAVSSMSDSQISNAAGFYNLFVPQCDSTLANYFLVRGIHVGDPGGLDDAAIVNAMAEKMKAGAGTVAFTVGPNSDFDASVKQLIRQMPAYLQLSAKTAGKALNLDSIRYLTDEPDRGVNIIVSYAVQSPNK